MSYDVPSEARAKMAVYMIAYGASDEVIAKELRTSHAQVKEWRALLSRIEVNRDVQEMLKSLNDALEEAGGEAVYPDAFTRMTMAEFIERYATNGIRFTFIKQNRR